MNLKYQWRYMDYAFPSDEARQQAMYAGTYDPEKNLPVGIEIWNNKLFVTVPRWSSGILNRVFRINRRSARKSSIDRIQSFQSKALPTILDAPWYVSNHTLHTDLNIPTVRKIRILSIQT
ncbi:hypothetical protein AAG570_005590 [Ranatra chinensis]|uniref:Protein yellow n=1 Tax=Ranatra chinensis TaxID=642074 RepID=A0ABD0Y0F5_9HEMI